jgi:hypothetical protein
MRTRRLVLIGVVAVVLVFAWGAFRPERLFIDAHVDESFPVAGAPGSAPPRALVSGEFHGVAHATHGRATVYEVDGRKVLRLSEFSTSNGPDVRVVLVRAADAGDSAAVRRAGYLEVGRLKGNIGDQNYDLPADFDAGSYRAITIWCERFSVNFGTAPLRTET